MRRKLENNEYEKMLTKAGRPEEKEAGEKRRKEGDIEIY